MIVIDSSVVLASFLREPGKDVFTNLADDFQISALNFGEIVSKLTERGLPPEAVQHAVAPLLANIVPLSAEHALQAGLWRPLTKQHGLSMGDRCCLALGLDLGAEVYTTDRAWAAVDLGVKVRVIR